MPKKDKTATQFKKAQNDDHKDAKRARFKQMIPEEETEQDSAVVVSDNEKNPPNDNDNDDEDSSSPIDDNNMQEEEEENEPDTIMEEINSNDAPKGGVLSVQELRTKFQNKLESLKPKITLRPDETADEKKSRRSTRKEKREKKQTQDNRTTTNTEKSKFIIKEKVIEAPTPLPAPADDLANLDFGKIDGLNPKAYYHQDNKALAHTQGGKKHLIHQLADAEKKQARVKELLTSGDLTSKEKAKKMQWTDTFKVASGERVTNDPQKLKKKIKQKAKQKEKSAKTWQARLDSQDYAQKEKQQIRTHNLSKRKLGGSVGANLSKKRMKDTDDDDRDD